MKRILRHYVIDTFSLFAIGQIASGLYYGKGFETLLIAGIGVTAVSLFAKPIINILLLPLNLVTFGLFRWISSAIIIYLVTLVVEDFKVVGFRFAGFEGGLFDVPEIVFRGVMAYIAFSFMYSIITSFIYWLRK